VPDASSPTGGFRTSGGTQFSFSPDGRAVVFTDLGPGPGADDAVQIFTLDVATGTRSQLTHLPAVPDRAVGTIGLYPGTAVPFFLPDGRIAFQSFGNLDGTNPEGNLLEFVMNRDGSDLRSVATPVVHGGRLVPIFGVTGAGVRRRADILSVPGTPMNPEAGTTGDAISEVFFIDGKNVLQLTHFGRVDTMTPNLTPDGHHVIFVASADPFGANPSGTCQVFSIGTVGSGLRQLTHFAQPQYSTTGCNTLEPPGCQILLPGRVDPATGTLLFYASCDPFGTNPYGDQLFAIRADGTGLRQLTHARGFVTEPDGSTSSENIGPVGISFAGPPPGSPPL
jgi:Tol biopolymer transport system component